MKHEVPVVSELVFMWPIMLCSLYVCMHKCLWCSMLTLLYMLTHCSRFTPSHSWFPPPWPSRWPPNGCWSWNVGSSSTHPSPWSTWTAPQSSGARESSCQTSFGKFCYEMMEVTSIVEANNKFTFCTVVRLQYGIWMQSFRHHSWVFVCICTIIHM